MARTSGRSPGSRGEGALGGGELVGVVDLVIVARDLGAPFGEGEQALLLGEDLGRREPPVDGALGDGPAVTTLRGLGRRWRREVDHAGEHDLVGEVVEPAVEGLGRDGGVGRDDGRQLSDELGDSPGGLLVGQGVERNVGDLNAHGVTQSIDAARLSHRLCHQALASDAEVVGTLSPLFLERERVRVLLAGTGVDDGVAFEPPALPRCRRAVVSVVEPVDRCLDADGDGLGALGELPEDRVGHIGDLGDAVGWLSPPDAEAAGQLGSQAGVVEAAQGLLVLFDGAGVERQPAPVG